jgi:Adenovirus endoprotease
MTYTQIYKDYLWFVQKCIGKKETDEHCLTAVGKHLFDDEYEGTYAADEVPSTPFRYAIVNIDKRATGGIHWVALARIDEGDTYMVYDSYGRRTAKIMPLLQLKTIDTQHDAEQTKAQTNCGARCLAWLLLFQECGSEAAKTI